MGDVSLGGPLGTGGASGRGGKRGVQGSGIDAAAVADAGQPGSQALGGEPVGALLAVEAREEAQADRTVDIEEEADGAREGALEVRAQLVGEGDAVGDQVLASPAGGPQGYRERAVGNERTQSGPVGAEGVGEDEGVEAIVLVAGRAVAGAEVLELVGTDDHDGQFGLEESLDDRTVGPFDGDLVRAYLGEPADQIADAGGGVGYEEPLDHLTAGIDDRHRVVVASPIHAGRPVARPDVRKGVLRRRLHVSLLAARPSGEAPYSWSRDAAASPLTVRRSKALSPIDGLRIPGNHRAPEYSCRTSRRRATKAMARWHLGGIGSLVAATDMTMVLQ